MPRQTRKLEIPAPIDPDTPLEKLTAAQLKLVWEATFPCPPLQPFYRSLAIRLIAFHRQELVDGGLSPELRQQLAEYAPGGVKDAARRAQPRVKPGTRLLRTWRGRLYAVTAGDGEFIYENRRYRSLSVIAREITGTPWSGPAFFGLKTAATPILEVDAS
ncbi:DUF2924 domain-containing protein [Rhodanobacter sp. L36]|uniref:DUF2924 domain-containing protein n=1 Tax=Rhodanobacter sp. L36 TaxID=1747221 RepID=UPI00131D7FAE|nr:DUF2924 domain-containing protein [Rhodanobacter sp. L36]